MAERELCDGSRTAQTAAVTAIATLDCFRLLFARRASEDLFVRLFPSPTDSLWVQCLTVGPARRNNEVRFAFLNFVRDVLVNIPLSLEYVLGVSRLKEYLQRADGEGNTQSVRGCDGT